MGILNINDDSFSGDGDLDQDWARAKAAELIQAGADIVDVGGESARTNRGPISEQEEIDRVGPFVEAFPGLVEKTRPRDAEQIFPPLLSVNTWRSGVVRHLLPIGGDILNDMSALPDAQNARACAETGAALLIMHSQGEPKVAHTHVQYADIMDTLVGFFREKIALCRSVGLPESALILDPGIDFAKQREANLEIYRSLHRLDEFGCPILLPVSRKGVIGEVLGLPEAKERDAGTVACLVAGLRQGAAIYRVHHVEAAYRAIQAVGKIETA